MNGHRPRGRWPAWSWRALTVWLAIATAESVHGVLRRILLDPALGEAAAGRTGVVIGSLIVLAIAFASRRWMALPGPSARLAAGGLWVLLTLAFEVGLGLALGLGWTRILADYDLAHGGLMPLGLAVMALAPLATGPGLSHRAKP